MFRKLAVALALCISIPSFAAVRLTYPNAGAVSWPQRSFPIPYQMDERVAAAFPEAAAVVDRAFGVWSSIPETNISFRSLGVGNNLRAGWNGVNSVTLTDDMFRENGFIAVTTNWYDNDGNVTEADIQIDASLMRSDYNIHQAIAHEVGHVLGLDHSAVISSLMYPWVGKTSGPYVLDSDDRTGISSIYPKTDPAAVTATLQGKIISDRGAVFAAQVVAVNQSGEPVATALSDSSGEFVLRSVPSGTYRLYAEPLDGPVEVKNLAGIWRTAKVESFGTEFLDGPPLRVEAGKIYGNLIVNTGGGTVGLNPRWIGVSSAGSGDFSMSSAAGAVRPGESISLAVGGDGFISAMTTFEVLNPGFRRVSDFRYGSNYVYATFSVAPDAPLGSAVVLVKSGNETAALTGALRLQAAVRTRLVRR